MTTSPRRRLMRSVDRAIGILRTGDADYFSFEKGNGVVRFRSSSGRTGSEPIGGKTAEEVIASLVKRFGLSKSDYEVI